MEILGDRKFVEVPGTQTHELPPLLVRTTPGVRRLDRVMDMASDLIEKDMIPALPYEAIPLGAMNLGGMNDERLELDATRRKLDLALNLVDQYLGLVQHWQWGDSILEWIRQCETTFETRSDLRSLLHPDVWPHAARSSFVTLLEDKSVQTGGVAIEKAVGMRLTFRQPPPLKCFSDQFLFYLNSTLANTAYQTWANLSPSPVSALPPERFQFQVLSTSLE
jgi:hypothetical protein